ncbi:MAG: 4Fe-4S binding protein, partial [Alistipes sp.]|nr:4Fe-4S binding protein [Alistipes sp.]
LVAGIGSVVALLAPYSSYGRIVTNLFAPFYRWGNNLLAWFAERVDSYAFYSADVWLRSLPTFLIATVTFVLLVVLAWRNGRTYCNTICPVGTILGFLSRHSLFRPVIDTAKCNGCKLCSRRCKAACIDAENHIIDYSRCVACMDCIDTCAHGAIRYARRKKEAASDAAPDTVADVSRRHFLTGSALLAGAAAAKAQEKKVDGGLAVLLDKKVPHRATPIVPPGAKGLWHIARHCTGCQLCVSACPNEVLRPSTDLRTLMQPESSYERGYCRPECTECSEVCPAGAIHRITPEEKTAIQIGHAVWIRENCIPLTDGVSCGNCARHCPTGAIQMIPSDAANPDAPKIPVVNEARCIGCGACENLCPARPFSAIYVEGYREHLTI